MESLVDKMREVRSRWFGHVKRRSMDVLIRRCDRSTITDVRRGKGRSNKYWKLWLDRTQYILSLPRTLPWIRGLEVVDYCRRLVGSRAFSCFLAKIELMVILKLSFLQAVLVSTIIVVSCSLILIITCLLKTTSLLHLR